MKKRYLLKPPTGDSGYLTPEETAKFTGMHPAVAKAFMDACITTPKPTENEKRAFGQDELDDLRLIQKLRSSKRPATRYLSLIFSLADELAETRRQLEILRSAQKREGNEISDQPKPPGSLRPQPELGQGNMKAHTATGILTEESKERKALGLKEKMLA